jgi:hypothetical protein
MDNAEGSSSSLNGFSFTQRSVLVGTMLGDGCLAKHGRYHRLHMKHKAAHKSLIEFKYEVFREFISMRLHGFDQRLNGAGYPCFQFATRTHPLFSDWYSRFYQSGRKIVPVDIAAEMTPLALAVWIMDDGAADHFGVTLQTHNFSFEEVRVLEEVVRERFDLATSVRGNRGRWIIYVKASSVGRLEEVVRPHLLRDFDYKLKPRRARTP